MSHTLQVEESASAVRRLWERHGIKQPLRFLGFCLSLLPVPGIQQAGQALDRHISDRKNEAALSAIWDEITRINARAASAETLEDAIVEVAKAVSEDPALQLHAQSFIQQLSVHNSEFIAIAEEGSFQNIVNSLISAESAQIIARSGAINVVENSTVNAQRTLLHSSSGASNYVNNTTFQGRGAGAVSMQGISTQGNITVEGSSIGFGPNSGIIFGGNPNRVSGSCSACRRTIELDRRQLNTAQWIVCPHCHTPLRVGPPPP